MIVNLSLDNREYMVKPNKGEISKISSRVACNPRKLSIQEIAELVGNRGCTFCPAIFNEGKRRADNFKEMQLFALDFDTGVSFEEIYSRAERYELSIAFAYHTFTSAKKHPKFRIVFISDISIEDRCAAEIMLGLLRGIFSESDKSCRDVSRMFFGGKGVIGQIRNQSIDLVSLTQNYQRYIFETEPRNYIRKIQNFAKYYDLSCVNSCIQICGIDTYAQNEDFLDSDPYIYGSAIKIPSKSPVYFIYKHYQPNKRESNVSQTVVRVELKNLEVVCQLYQDFICEHHIPHDDRFLLMTNMLCMNGGRKRFLEIIKKKEYDRKKWEFYVKYAKDKRYKPQSCDGNCPYSENCTHTKNIVSTVGRAERIKRLQGEEQYYSVNEVYEHIVDCITDAIANPREGLYLIPAQTAVGKTQAYCEIVSREYEQRFLIAVPTNRLKREVERRLKNLGADILVTLSIDEINLPQKIKDKVAYYYQLGLGEEISTLLNDFIKNTEDSSVPEQMLAVQQCREYLNLNVMLERSRHLITTHARLATLTSDVIKKYTVIVDEDILATFFKNIRTVSIQAVEQALKSDACPFLLQEKLNKILNIATGGYIKLGEPVSFRSFNKSMLEELEILENVNDVARASVCCRENDKIHYFCPQYLVDGKYIILSATGEADLYKQYFSKTYFQEYPYYRAKYQGRLVEFTYHSVSRQNVKEHWNSFQELLSKIKDTYHIITFLEFESQSWASKLHFGNVEGVDELCAKNIAVIGTPHLNEFIYKLIGFHLGFNVEKDILAVRRIKYKNYDFNLMTYGQEQLRKLQLYFIGKELEQCIGRARLLRNACTVAVFSNFPCEQAELIQDDYLSEDYHDRVLTVCDPDLAGSD